MEFFKTNTTIGFMKQRYIAAILSAVIIIGSIASLSINHLRLGLDFTGGTQIEASFSHSFDANTIRDHLNVLGYKQAVVTPYDQKEVSIKVGMQYSQSQEQIKSQVQSAIPKASINSIQYIGPQVGKQLMTNGILALLVSLLATMVYIALRFEYRFALSAALALIHDPVLILGVFSFFHIEFNMIGLTALLTVIGYSLNDTIVVYDRVRENFRKVRKLSPTEIMDLSINQTLSRTIMTSGLTLIVVVALYVYGGGSIQGFALALMIGIVVGTYSSIYVAGSLAIMFGLNRQSLLPKSKGYADELP